MGIITRRRNSINMVSLTIIVLVGLVLCNGLVTMAMAKGYDEDERKEYHHEFDDQPFLLKESKPVMKTEAGEMRVVVAKYEFGGGRGKYFEGPMRIGFIMMEPKSLFVPQYLDSDFILFVRQGEAKVGYIYKDQLAERRLKIGDVYRIPAGSAFYLVNLGEGQRLHIICSFDTSESLRFGSIQSFFVGGGINPISILSGFDSEILENAFNVTHAEVKDLLTGQQEGPIVYISDSRAPRVWSKFLSLKESEKFEHLKSLMFGFDDEGEEERERAMSGWFWRKMLGLVYAGRDKKPEDYKGKGKSPDSYNLYDAKADYKNDYGWSIAVDGSNYKPLKKSDFGVYLVNLTAGSMMAPHLNPRATEYGIVLRGSGTVQVVYPNGTRAMTAEVNQGDVFFIPRYFPFCQVASRVGPMEFFGFTTSSHKNRPQFLAGASSLLRSMHGPELAAAFGLAEDVLRDITEAQREAVILPSASAAPPVKGKEVGPEVIRTYTNGKN